VSVLVELKNCTYFFFPFYFYIMSWTFLW